MTEECYAIGLYQDGRPLAVWDGLGLEKAKRIYRAYFNDPDFGLLIYKNGERLKLRDAWVEMAVWDGIRLTRPRGQESRGRWKRKAGWI